VWEATGEDALLVFYEQVEPFQVWHSGGSATDPARCGDGDEDCRSSATGAWGPERDEPEVRDAEEALDRLRTEHDRERHRMASFDHL
jgi:hypothetical protein